MFHIINNNKYIKQTETITNLLNKWYKQNGKVIERWDELFALRTYTRIF